MSAVPDALPPLRSAPMTPALVVLVLSLLLGIQPVTTDTAAALTQGLWFWSAVIAATAWTLVQRDGRVCRD